MPKTSNHLCVNGRAVVLSSDHRPQSEQEYRLCPAISGGDVRVETLSDMFSADAVCAAAFFHAVSHSTQGRCIVMTECGGTAGIVPVVVETDAGKATAVLPVPVIEQNDAMLRVEFPGVTCLVSQQDARLDSFLAPTLFVLRDTNCENIQVWFRPATDAAWTALPSSGIAAASAAIDLAVSMPDGVVEYGVGMIGGSAEVGVSKRGGALAGLSICSSVMFEENK